MKNWSQTGTFTLLLISHSSLRCLNSLMYYCRTNFFYQEALLQLHNHETESCKKKKKKNRSLLEKANGQAVMSAREKVDTRRRLNGFWHDNRKSSRELSVTGERMRIPHENKIKNP